MLTRRRVIALSAAAALAPNVLARAQSSAWPNRPVRLIVPLAAGGPTDTLARVVGDELSKLWGQQVVIENKPGGGTNIANEYVARSEPDGYTALFGTSSLATVGSLYHSLGYDPAVDLAPVSLVAKFPFFMFVPNSSPAKSVLEFIADAKAHPGKRIMGNPGTGSAPHLTAELFLQMAKIKMTHVPYRGAAPAFVDLIPGRIDCYFGSGELLTYSRSGQVRALATTGAQRSAAEPELPTIAEAGVPGYAVEFLAGRFPAGQDAGRNYQPHEQRHHHRACRARDQRQACADGLCGTGIEPQRFASMVRGRLREVERGDQDRRHQDRVDPD